MRRALVVDDNAENRYFLRTLLEGHGWAVVEAAHGAEALTKAREEAPDLAISDLLMPVMDGYTLLRRWKSDAGLRGIPFVVFTATYTQAEDEQLALDLGADGFILKPAEPDAFLAKITEVLNRGSDAPPPPVRTVQAPPNELLIEYGEVLVRKLEEKNLQLQAANEALQQDIAAREDAERRVEETAARLTAILESITDGFLTLDGNEVLAYVNVRAEEILGVRREDLLGRNFWEVFPEARDSAFHEGHRRARREGVTVVVEDYYPPFKAWFEVRIYPSGDQLSLYFRDVTESVNALRNLRESEERFRGILESIRHVAVNSFDLDGIVQFWNKASEEIYGFSAAEALGKDGVEILVPPEQRPDARRLLEAYRAGAPIDPENLEWTLLRRDGTRVDVLTSYHRMDVPGRPPEIFNFDIDVTERNRAREELVREKEFTRLLLENLDSGVVACDASGTIILANETARLWHGVDLKGLSPRERGASYEIYEEDGRTLVPPGQTPLDRVFSGERVYNAAVVLKAGTQPPRHLLVSASMIRAEDGRALGAVVIMTDITERKRLEQQFLRSQRMESIGNLAGGIAHDLNNVLAPITMSIDLLKTKVTDEGSRSILTTIGGSARRAAELVSQVLAFARGMDGRRVPVDLRQLFADMERMLAEVFPRNISIEIDPAPELWMCRGDPTQIHQVLLNLCLNARDAMGGGGRLVLRARNEPFDAAAAADAEIEPGAYVVLEVEDSGSGMPPEIVQQIFDPFFTTKAPGQGTGLGLSTSLAIIKSHGGYIRVYSEIGRGTCVRVGLPAPADARFALPLPEQIAETPRGKGETILVVDDEASVRQITKQALEAFGYKVILASDGAEALAAFVQRQSEIDLVFTDMMMPIMDGPATIRALRRIRPDLRIIAASGLNANGRVAQAVEAGAEHFLPKPYTAESLLQLIARVLAEEAPSTQD